MNYLESFLAQRKRVADEVLSELYCLGFDVRPNGDRVRLKGPVHKLTPALKARVLQVKLDLLKLLKAATLEQDLYTGEVLELPAARLLALPVPTALVLVLPGRRRLTLAAHHGYAGGAAQWAELCAQLPGCTVRKLLSWLGATLRAVIIEGGASRNPVFRARARPSDTAGREHG